MRYIDNLMQLLKGSALLPWPVRKLVLVSAGSTFGRDTYIECGLLIGKARLVLGNDVYINKYLLVDGDGEIRIGSKVRIGPACKFITSFHAVSGDPSAPGCGEISYRPIIIEHGAWFGAGVTVLPGVTVAESCVIAAGAVVTRDTAPSGLYGGIPARRLKDYYSPESRATIRLAGA